MRALIDRLRRRGRLLLELFLVPGACALLPWPVALRLLHRLAALPFWYRSEVELATAHAHRLGFAPDPEAFARRARLRMLVDNHDGYQTLLRGRRYIQRWIDIEGDPLPAKGPLLFVGLHHGCGFWFLPAVRELGLGPTIVAPRVDHLTSRSGRLEATYLRWRLKLIARAAGRPLVYRGAAGEGLRQLLGDGGVGFGLPDIPTARTDAVPVSIAGLPSKLAQGLYEIAQSVAAPIYFFTTDTDLNTGRRKIGITLCTAQTPEQATAQYAQVLSAAIARDPTGWRFWSIAPDLFPSLFADQSASG